MFIFLLLRIHSFNTHFHHELFHRFKVHRNIMLASSPYFKALLGPNYKETRQNEVVLKELDGKTLETVIHFCYSGHVEITGDTIGDIMAAASSMELVHLEQRCSHFWNDKLNIANCVEILMIADKYMLKDLWNESLNYASEKFDKIPKADMCKLDEKNFDAILAKDKIGVAESYIFDCFVKWVSYDEKNRSKFVATLAKSIRLQHIPVEVNYGVDIDCSFE